MSSVSFGSRAPLRSPLGGRPRRGAVPRAFSGAPAPSRGRDLLRLRRRRAERLVPGPVSADVVARSTLPCSASVPDAEPAHRLAPAPPAELRRTARRTPGRPGPPWLPPWPDRLPAAGALPARPGARPGAPGPAPGPRPACGRRGPSWARRPRSPRRRRRRRRAGPVPARSPPRPSCPPLRPTPRAIEPFCSASSATAGAAWAPAVLVVVARRLAVRRRLRPLVGFRPLVGARPLPFEPPLVGGSVALAAAVPSVAVDVFFAGLAADGGFAAFGAVSPSLRPWPSRSRARARPASPCRSGTSPLASRSASPKTPPCKWLLPRALLGK